MDTLAKIQWLQDYTQFGDLSEAALGAIATAIIPVEVAANRRLLLEDVLPPALYILHSGHLESYRTSPNSLAKVMGLLPGAILYLKELMLDEIAEETTITLDDCVIWQIPRTEFLAIATQYPEIAQLISQQMATELQEAEVALAYERDRQAALRPYLVPKARRGIVGSSRYAIRLRQDIKKATSDRQPVVIFGEPGLEKDNIAALIHFASRDRKEPLVQLNCNTLQANGSEIFGRGNKPGILHWMGRGTLMLNNFEDLPEHLLDPVIHLLKTGQYLPISRDGEEPIIPHQSVARIILTTEKVSSQLEQCKQVQKIKVPPLRVRKSDLANQVDYYLSLLCRSRGIPKPKLTPEALRRLQGYDFPGNLTELEQLVKRALAQAAGAEVLTEEIFWVTGDKTRSYRLNLLNAFPKLRRFLRSDWYPDRVNYGFTLPIFAVVVGVLMVGPQSRDRNFALNLFWDWWWLGSLLIYPFLGRIWCAFCPFMIYGEVVQKLSLKWFPRTLRAWPRQQAEPIAGWFLFALFVLILLWEELWNLENTAYLSGCLLLLITAGAIVFSLLFERRFWCRYLCPIGGMNGMFAKLAMIELRAKQGICSASCTTYQCYKGGAQKGEGQETGGCPIYSHPAQLQENKDCVLCMTCLKACPHRSVELNLRPPAIELWTTHSAKDSEVALLFLMLGAAFLHRLPEFSSQYDLQLPLQQFGWHGIFAILALFFPGFMVFLADTIARSLVNPTTRLKPFRELAYGFLPLTLGGLMAHYLSLGLGEAGRIIPVTLATFGLTGGETLVLVAHPAVIEFLQGTALLGSLLATVLLTQKIAKQSWSKLLPFHLTAIALAGLLWSAIGGW
ncbi:MAG: sigma 54-interacting transcriptional regulator [Synechococcales bacterium]|nr:sigma 54-interacting transcriptional regulator [Synechococcales bacterium]